MSNFLEFLCCTIVSLVNFGQFFMIQVFVCKNENKQMKTVALVKL